MIRSQPLRNGSSRLCRQMANAPIDQLVEGVEPGDLGIRDVERQRLVHGDQKIQPVDRIEVDLLTQRLKEHLFQAIR